MNIDHLQKLSTKDLNDLHYNYGVLKAHGAGSDIPQRAIEAELAGRGER
jgi:hypothetical protein